MLYLVQWEWSMVKNLPLYKQIQDDIKERILSGELRPGDRIPSEKELAEEYHVSQITSKNALIGLADEGILTRHQGKGTFVNEEVWKVLNTAGTAQRTGTTYKGTIGLIIPTLQTKVEQRIVDNIERFAWASGYQLMLSISRESQRNESEAIEAFNRNGVKGVVIFPTEEENYNEDILRLSIDKFPLVLIDRYLKDIKTYSVSADNEKGTFNAVSYLLEQGHRNIALISPVITNTVTEDRAAGFERAFYQNQLPINKNQWCILNINDIHNGNGEEMIYDFFRSHPEITAAFVMNAQLTNYAYDALLRLGKKVPEDFTLFGFDEPGRPGIHYVEQDIATMCKHTVECLLEQMEGRSNPRRVTVPVELIIKNIIYTK